MSARDLDRGMHAVKRARSVREQDSRIGLQQALREHTQRRMRLESLQAQMTEASAWRDGDVSSYLVRRHGLLALGEAIVSATGAVEAARQIVDSAHAHWSSDKVRLSAVESLLERRAEERRVERARREAVELDDIATQLWTRNRRSTSSVRSDRPALSVPVPHTAPTDLESAR